MSSLNMIPTQIPHVYRIDLDGSGIAHECAVLQKDDYGNVLYLKISELDNIDRERIGKILHHRYIRQLPLWDVMSQSTLKNNVNALEYFHQLVRGITADGRPYVPRAGARGYSINQTIQIAEQQMAAQRAEAEARKAAAEASDDSVPAKKGPGRPPKS